MPGAQEGRAPWQAAGWVSGPLPSLPWPGLPLPPCSARRDDFARRPAAHTWPPLLTRPATHFTDEDTKAQGTQSFRPRVSSLGNCLSDPLSTARWAHAPRFLPLLRIKGAPPCRKEGHTAVILLEPGWGGMSAPAGPLPHPEPWPKASHGTLWVAHPVPTSFESLPLAQTRHQ